MPSCCLYLSARYVYSVVGWCHPAVCICLHVMCTVWWDGAILLSVFACTLCVQCGGMVPSCCLYLSACYVYSVVGWCHPAVCICLHVMCTVWWDGAILLSVFVCMLCVQCGGMVPSCCLYLPARYVYSVVGWCHPAVCICLHVMCTVWWDGAILLSVFACTLCVQCGGMVPSCCLYLPARYVYSVVGWCHPAVCICLHVMCTVWWDGAILLSVFACTLCVQCGGMVPSCCLYLPACICLHVVWWWDGGTVWWDGGTVWWDGGTVWWDGGTVWWDGGTVWWDGGTVWWDGGTVWWDGGTVWWDGGTVWWDGGTVWWDGGTVWWDGATWRLVVSFWHLYLHACYMCRCCADCNTGTSVLKSLCPTRPLSCMKTAVTSCTCRSSSLLTSPVWRWLACGEWCCAHPHAPLQVHQTRRLAPRQTPGLARLLIHCHIAPHPHSWSCVETGGVPTHTPLSKLTRPTLWFGDKHQVWQGFLYIVILPRTQVAGPVWRLVVCPCTHTLISMLLCGDWCCAHTPTLSSPCCSVEIGVVPIHPHSHLHAALWRLVLCPYTHTLISMLLCGDWCCAHTPTLSSPCCSVEIGVVPIHPHSHLHAALALQQTPALAKCLAGPLLPLQDGMV